MSHIHFLIFTLNSLKEAASLYSNGSFAQRNGALCYIRYLETQREIS